LYKTNVDMTPEFYIGLEATVLLISFWLRKELDIFMKMNRFFYVLGLIFELLLFLTAFGTGMAFVEIWKDILFPAKYIGNDGQCKNEVKLISADTCNIQNGQQIIDSLTGDLSIVERKDGYTVKYVYKKGRAGEPPIVEFRHTPKDDGSPSPKISSVKLTEYYPE